MQQNLTVTQKTTLQALILLLMEMPMPPTYTLGQFRGGWLLIVYLFYCTPHGQRLTGALHSTASLGCCAGKVACTSAQVSVMLVSRCSNAGASALPTRTCAAHPYQHLTFRLHENVPR